MERPILMKFGTVMRLGPADTNSKQKFTILETRHPGYRALRHIATGSSVKTKRLTTHNRRSPYHKMPYFDCCKHV